MSANYIHFMSKTMNPVDLTKEARALAERTWLCTGCGRPRHGSESIDAHVQDDQPEGPLNGLNGCFLALAKTSFLFQFGEERIRRDLHLGKVYGPDEEPLHGWVTFRGKHRVFIRGTDHAVHRVCPGCGRDVYFAMGHPYLYPQPPAGVEVLESDLCGLVLPEAVVQEVGIGQPKGVWVERLTVVKQPKDGFGVLVP